MKSETGSYPHNKELQDYLLKYVETFDLKKHIKFKHIVNSVEPLEPEEAMTRWRITGSQIDNPPQSFETTLDIVMACSGKESLERLPDIPNMSAFTGSQLHSKYYTSKQDERIKDKAVVVFGGSASGLDLMEDIRQTARTVYFSLGRPGLVLASGYNYGANVSRKGGIREIGENWIKFEGEDDQTQVDTIVWCTGYVKSFPYLGPETGVLHQEENRVLSGLYKHVICMRHPTLAVINLIEFNLPWILADVQTQYFLTLHKRGILPSMDKMTVYEAEYTRWMECVGSPPRRRHFSRGANFFILPTYIKGLCEEASI